MAEAVAPEQVGQKLSRQARMAAAGLAVPPFFCVPVTCWMEVVEPVREEISRRLDAIDYGDSRSVEEHAAALRALVHARPIPEAMAGAFLTAFDELLPEGGRVSVRSSMLGADASSGEDSATDSFAGMADTRLFVSRPGLLEAVGSVWASVFTSESLIYRHARGGDAREARMAVGVQAMVPGRRSFVLFTRDPRTGSRETVIAAGYGVGEGVVREKVEIDHFYVASGGVRSETTVKERALVRDAGAGGDELVTQRVPEEDRERPVLDDAEAERLADLGARVERLFGAAQDIEGTIDAAGRVHLLQARPIPIDPRLLLWWSNANVTESFPGVTTTLTYTFAQRFYRTIFTDFYLRLGVGHRSLHDNSEHLDRMIGLANGRIYYRLTSWYRLHRQLRLFPLFRASWQSMMGIEDSSEASADTVAGIASTRLGVALRLSGPVARMVRLLVGHDRAMRGFEARWRSVIAPRQGVDWSGREPLACVNEFHDVWREVGDLWGATLVNDTLLGATSGITRRLFARWVPDAGPGLVNDLLCGDEDIVSVAAVRSLVDLAAMARERPALVRALEQEPHQELWRAIERHEHGADFAAAVRRHIDRYGDRGVRELKLEEPTPRLCPWLLLPLIRDYVRTDITGDGLRATEQALRSAAERTFAGRTARRPVRRAILRFLLGRLRRYIRYRENSRYSRGELFGFARAVCAGLGGHLAAREVLDDARDVQHLALDELFGYFDGTGPTADLGGLVEVRRREFEDAGAEPPMFFTTLGAVRDSWPVPRAAPAAARPLLRGTGSSGGRVRGTARVVHDPRERIEPCGDMILVAKETDPGWLFLMLRARGIVVERGTMLSHTAITGRKFAIPTIVSVPGATAEIPDGAVIEMDGTTGEIVLPGGGRDG
ncbi:PEP/pyruvate-binding domain-containing protein [Allosalinactinospora lopnorensis]|uniref:PEP/pyruvate-binding domain-containing protein n=1 Tax=Allosalinactinospora lopnorensis TaxID=1352348 RepID=UPI000623CD54|nr:PEP/pyruvate-binding domain-containing protein [Allosalinactinospora lopnorensis]